ncbi:MAG: hypothetical protein WBL97_17710, partial [Candidatus Sulfotelmatobacter sp.]
MGCAAAGFAGEFAEFELTLELGLELTAELALEVFSAVPFTGALAGSLPVAESPEAGFSATFFTGSPLAGCALPVALPAAADTGAGFATNLG